MGIFFGKLYKQRLEELRELERIINFVQGEIKYKHSVLADAFFSVSDRSRAPFKGWLFSLGEALSQNNKDESFFSIWEKSLSCLRTNSALKEGDYKELLAIGQAFSNTDIDSQEKSILYEREIIHARVVSLDKGMADRMKTSIVFCGLSGILIVVILL